MLFKYSDTTVCEDLRVGYKQIHVNSSCYRIFPEKVNWYEARWRCLKAGMDLAVIHDINTARQLANKINRNFGIFKLTHYWIGFRNSDWIIDNSSAG